MEAPEVTGRVLALIQGEGTLEADIDIETRVACARCREGRGCGAGLLGGAGRTRVLRVDVPPGTEVAAGDEVTLRMSGSALLAAAATAYGLPLSGLLVGALLGYWFIPGDTGAILTALAGLTAGAGIARRRAARLCWQHEASGLMRLETGLRR